MGNTTHPRKAHYYAYQLNSKAKSTLAIYQCLAKRNTNSVLMDFQKTASILFYVDVKYVSVRHNNLRNADEVIDITGHNIPPVIDQLQDATSSSLSSNTLSSLLSYVLSPLSSNNSSRSLTSVRSKTNLDNNSLFPSSSQLTKNGKGN
jgi:hypothetical protein